MGHRRQAREAAMQIWYQVDIGRMTPTEALATYWETHQAATDIVDFSRVLVEGTASKQDALDALLAEHSAHWRLERMAAVDRNILRVATYELLHCRDIPTKVTINEAIEIAKKFGTEESGAFINGILDHIAKSVDQSPT
jgi:transcription antitermination protein NusB